MDDATLRNQIGSNIAAYRKQAGLTQAGLADGHVDTLSLCTACHPELYWSHRKMGNARGAQVAVISL